MDNGIEKEYEGEGIVLEDRGIRLESKATELYDIDGVFEEDISKEGISKEDIEGIEDKAVSDKAA